MCEDLGLELFVNSMAGAGFAHHRGGNLLFTPKWVGALTF